MKKITLLLCVLTSYLGFSQTYLPIDFESAVNSKGDNALVFSIEDQGAPQNNVGKLVKGNSNPWDNAQLELTKYIDLTGSNKTVSFKWKSTSTATCLLKLESSKDGAGNIEKEFTPNGSGNWETIDVEFDGANDQYSKIVIFANKGNVGNGTYYVDDITGVVGDDVPEPIVAAAPTDAPTTPNARNASDVISVYSEAYSNISATWHPSWGQTTVYEEVTIASNTLTKLSNFGYEGLTYSSMDVSDMETVHFDVWTDNETSIKFFILAGSEPFVSKTLTANTWNSFDIDLTEFTGATLTTNTGFKVESGTYTWPNGVSTVYIDNVYFYKTVVDPLTDATLSDIQINSSSLTGFSSEEENYEVVLAKGTTSIPQITSATKSHSGANVVITQAPQLPGDATITVTSEDGNTSKTYTISFSVDDSTACQGTSSEATEGSYSVGYDYNIETLGTGATDVKVTFTLLDDDKIGYVPQVFIAPSTFIDMTADGSTYTATLTDQVGGISFTVRGAYAGGLVTSQLFEYTVGDTCDPLLSNRNSEIEGLKTYPNPTGNNWNISIENETINSIEVFNLIGGKIISTQPNTSKATIDASELDPGMYVAIIKTDLGTSSLKLIKK